MAAAEGSVVSETLAVVSTSYNISNSRQNPTVFGGNSADCNNDCDMSITELMGELGPLLKAFDKKGGAIDNCKKTEEKKEQLTLSQIQQYLTLDGAVKAVSFFSQFSN